MYEFGFGTLWKGFGITTSGGNLKPFQGLLIMTAIGLVLYIHQMFQEGLLGGGNKGNENFKKMEQRLFRISSKVKAK